MLGFKLSNDLAKGGWTPRPVASLLVAPLRSRPDYAIRYLHHYQHSFPVFPDLCCIYACVFRFLLLLSEVGYTTKIRSVYFLPIKLQRLTTFTFYSFHWDRMSAKSSSSCATWEKLSVCSKIRIIKSVEKNITNNWRHKQEKKHTQKNMKKALKNRYWYH